MRGAVSHWSADLVERLLLGHFPWRVQRNGFGEDRARFVGSLHLGERESQAIEVACVTDGVRLKQRARLLKRINGGRVSGFRFEHLAERRVREPFLNGD